MECEYLRLQAPLILIPLSTVKREIAIIKDFTDNKNSYFLINKYVDSFPKLTKRKDKLFK